MDVLCILQHVTLSPLVTLQLVYNGTLHFRDDTIDMTLTNFLVISLFVGLAFSTPAKLFDLELNDSWALFKSKFNKTYTTGDEELIRRSIWEESVRYVQKHNLEHDLGKHSYTTGVNEFSDLSSDEFESIYLSSKFPIERNENDEYYMPPQNVKEKVNFVDWRRQGYVTAVKNQGRCGSCWSFSTTGSLEGQTYRKYRKLISLSEQQLVDCSGRFGNNGCNGGLMSRAIAYVQACGGLETERDYPYVAVQRRCVFNRSKVAASANGYVNIRRTEKDLENVVAHVGPISIAIDASHPSFSKYNGGVYYEPTCSTTSLDHAVLIVGYGKDTLNRSYWIVKNSWGSGWGLGGYILMAKDRGNQCGVATLAGYPRV